jgi:hypothetical protein
MALTFTYHAAFIALLMMYLFGIVLWGLFGVVDVLSLRIFFYENPEREEKWFSKIFSEHPELESAATHKSIEEEMVALAARLNSEFGPAVVVDTYKEMVFVRTVNTAIEGNQEFSNRWYDTIGVTMMGFPALEDAV